MDWLLTQHDCTLNYRHCHYFLSFISLVNNAMFIVHQNILECEYIMYGHCMSQPWHWNFSGPLLLFADWKDIQDSVAFVFSFLIYCFCKFSHHSLSVMMYQTVCDTTVPGYARDINVEPKPSFTLPLNLKVAILLLHVSFTVICWLLDDIMQ